MFAIRQVIENPQDVIPVPPELRHRRTEVIFIALDQETLEMPSVLNKQLLSDAENVHRANWFEGYRAEADVDDWEALHVDDVTEEWQW